MMKIKKGMMRFISLMVATLTMLFGSVTMVHAEEPVDGVLNPENIVSVEKLDNGKTRTTYEFELTPESVDENGVATFAIDSSFTMTGTYYRGADRKYDGNYLDYTMIVTGADGSAQSNKMVSIQLWDYNHSYSLQTDVVRADGSATTEFGVPIVANRTYYFKYYLATGTSSNLRIRMIIDAWWG